MDSEAVHDMVVDAVHTSVWWGRRRRPSEPWAAPVPALPADQEVRDVVVVGAGLTGLCTALLLARDGVRPLVLEARHVAAGTTGHSTAKLSLLQGSVYSGIARHAGADVVRAYAEAQRAGQELLLDLCAGLGVDVQRRDAWTYAVTRQGATRIAAERQECLAARLDVTSATPGELPFPVRAALRLPDQAQFDPVALCLALRDEVVRLGGTVLERITVTGLNTRPGRAGGRQPAVLRTSLGEIRARRVVLATGTPVLDRGLYFTQLQPQRSYALAFRMADPTRMPAGMYLSVDSPARSLRTAPDEQGELLLVGGNNHVVGRSASPAHLVSELETWARTHFAGLMLVNSWAAQDYRSTSQLPIVGAMPRSNGQVLVATGFNKWGMASAAMAALVLAADLGGEGADRDLPWAMALRTGLPSTSDVLAGLQVNASVGIRLARDWACRAVPGGDDRLPGEGQGHVQGGLHPTGTCTVAGVTHRVDAVCPHLGGILGWNDSDLTWDCPLHGSRFTADGHRIEGPALHDLKPR